MTALRIAAIALHPLQLPMARPIKMAGETLTHALTLLTGVRDEAGRTGWGEASAAPLMTGETLASLTAHAETLARRLVGATVATPAAAAALLDTLLEGHPSAKACLETALMDLFAQRAGLPLHALLRGDAGAPVARLEMLHMLASGDLEGEREEAAHLRLQGYRHWKIKVGSGDVENDARRIEVLCDDLRGDVVSADANTALTAAGAHQIAHAGARAGLAFLEQPFRVGQVAAMAQLHRATGLPLCADESIHSTTDIEAHHTAGAAQGASLKLIKLGGTGSLVAAGRLCLRLGLRVNLACKVAETTVSAAATAHAGFALGAVDWGFSMSNRYLATDICDAPLKPEEGAVHLHQLRAPGLGFAPSPSRLREFASAQFPAMDFRG